MTERDVNAVADAIVQRLNRQGGLVVRLADAQIDAIAERVLARVDERIAPREVRADQQPHRRGRGLKI